MIIKRSSAVNILTVFAVFQFLGTAFAFRLNVPRVLLPYHPENQVQFLLEVTHPEGGCFAWRSSKTDVVSVEAFNGGNSKGCSDKAIITSRSRYTDQQSAVIFAEEQGGGLVLSCDVTVDVIDSIAITTTTKVLFVDAAPALLVVEALNKEGDRFSTLGNIPFDWFFTYNEGRPLHIVPFAQSKYDSPPGIEELEQRKKKGYIVLVEGVSTGSAQLSAKFHEPYFSHIPSNSIDLYVLANVMLVPSYDLYLPVFSIVKYEAVILRKGRTEAIALPSTQYQLIVNNSTICDLNSATSSVTAKNVGSTEISLVDKFMKPRADIKPRSAHIFVVEPDSMQFSISRGNNWYLQLDVEYEVSVKLVDQLGNSVFIPENAAFTTTIPETYFSILEQSKNGSYFRVRAKKAGKLAIKSSFDYMLTQDGKKIKVLPVKGEQALEILTPIKVEPANVVFPHSSKHRYEYKLKATGGSGTYHWMSGDPSIAQVGESTGILKSGRVGEVVITAQDAYNNLNRGTSKVFVTEPYELQFAPSPVEAEIGSTLTLNLKLSGQTTSGLIPFTDCRHAIFSYNIAHSDVFVIDENVQPTVPAGDGCTTVSLYAVREGDTRLTVSFNRYTAEIAISAYPPLKINVKSDLLLTLGSGVGITFEGGPRPWALDPSKYTTSVSAEKRDVINAVIGSGKSFQAFCRNKLDDSNVILTVSNRKSVENPMPAVATANAKFCCSVPSNMVLAIPRTSNSDLPVCPSFSHSIYFNAPFNLLLSAQGRCNSETDADERAFDSINSLSVKYITNSTMLKVEKMIDDTAGKNWVMAVGSPRGVSGPVEIEAVVAHFHDLGSNTPTHKIAFPNAQFRTTLALNLVDFARANPSQLVLWNDKSVKGQLKINGGSGHFWIDTQAADSKISATLHGTGKDSATEIEVVPKSGGISRVTVFDLCIEGSKLDIEVKVTDISGIHLESSSFVPVGSTIGLKVAILDVDKHPFSGSDSNDIQVSLATGVPGSDPDVAELVLKNLATKQVMRFPVSLKLTSEVAQKLPTKSAITPQKSTSISSQSSRKVEYGENGSKLSYSLFAGIREVLAAFFEGYQTFVLSTFILLLSVLIFAAAYRYGFLYPIVGGPSAPTSSGIRLSPIQQIQPFGFRGPKSVDRPVFGDRPVFHSTPGNSFGGVDGGSNRISPLMRRSMVEEPNLSRHSAGSDDDPYLWTSNDNSKMHNSSLINRHYK